MFTDRIPSEDQGPCALTPNTVELAPTLGALSPPEAGLSRAGLSRIRSSHAPCTLNPLAQQEEEPSKQNLPSAPPLPCIPSFALWSVPCTLNPEPCTLNPEP